MGKLQKNMQKKYKWDAKSCIMELRTNNNQKHERRRPKCGISNEETAKPHEECIPNPAKNQEADGSSRKIFDTPRAGGNGSAGISDVAVRELSHGFFGTGKYGKATEACNKRADTEGGYGAGRADQDRVRRSRRNSDECGKTGQTESSLAAAWDTGNG